MRINLSFFMSFFITKFPNIQNIKTDSEPLDLLIKKHRNKLPKIAGYLSHHQHQAQNISVKWEQTCITITLENKSFAMLSQKREKRKLGDLLTVEIQLFCKKVEFLNFMRFILDFILDENFCERLVEQPIETNLFEIVAKSVLDEEDQKKLVNILQEIEEEKNIVIKQQANLSILQSTALLPLVDMGLYVLERIVALPIAVASNVINTIYQWRFFLGQSIDHIANEDHFDKDETDEMQNFTEDLENLEPSEESKLENSSLFSCKRESRIGV